MLPSLQRLVIEVETCDLYALERFLTFAVNTVGQRHLKKKVTAYLCGDLAEKSQNLSNALSNLCYKTEDTSMREVLAILEISIEE
jgi:hypothetical protein